MDPIKKNKRDLSEKQSISRPNSFVFRNNPAQASSTFVDTPSIANKRFDVTDERIKRTRQPYDEGSISPMSRSSKVLGPSISEIVTYGVGQKPGYMSGRNVPDNYYEPIAENIAEFFDPTGILSHDDARASYDTWKKSGRSIPTFEESLNMVSAIPAIGKLKFVGRIANQPKLFDFLQGSWNTFITTAESAKKIDRFSDFKELMQQFDKYLSKKYEG
jgi:hypothetical protein